jgi:hypothetical protein
LRKYLLLTLLLVLGSKEGCEYITSEDFQRYGDKKKAPWTCRVNNFLASVHVIRSNYSEAIALYDRVLARCPETTIAANAMFHRAECFDHASRVPEAIDAYSLYAETFPEGERIRTVHKAIDRLKFSR